MSCILPLSYNLGWYSQSRGLVVLMPCREPGDSGINECADDEEEDDGKHEWEQLVKQAEYHSPSPYSSFRICFISLRFSAK